VVIVLGMQLFLPWLAENTKETYVERKCAKKRSKSATPGATLAVAQEAVGRRSRSEAVDPEGARPDGGSTPGERGRTGVA